MLKKVLVLFLFCSFALSVPIYSQTDPNNDPNWNWLSGTSYWIYSSVRPEGQGCQTPFVYPENESVLDNKPEDGWVLLLRDFGTPTRSTPTPFFILYNKYQGLLRIFVLPVISDYYTSGMITMNWGTTARTAALNHLEPTAWGEDKIDSTKNNSSAAYHRVVSNHWSFADFPVDYESNIALFQNTRISFNIWGSVTSNVSLNIGGDILQTFGDSQPANLPTRGFFQQGGEFQLAQKAVQGTQSTWLGWQQTISDIAKGIKDTTKPSLRNLKHSIDALSKSWLVSNLGAIGVGVGLLDFFVTGGRITETSKPAPLSFKANFRATGTISTDYQLGGPITVPLPGAIHTETATPTQLLYNHPLGVLSIKETPILQHRKYDMPVGGSVKRNTHSFRLKKDLIFNLNPSSDLEIVEIKAALVYEPRTVPIADEFIRYTDNNNINGIDNSTINLESATDNIYVFSTPYVNGNSVKYQKITVPSEAKDFYLYNPQGDAWDFAGVPDLQQDELIGKIYLKVFATLKVKNSSSNRQPIILISKYNCLIEAGDGVDAPWPTPPTPFSVNVTRSYDSGVSEVLPTQYGYSGTDNITLSTPINVNNYKFMCWSDGLREATRTLTSNANLVAYYKAVNKSSCQTAFSNNSQKKLVHIYGGCSEKVYESMNKIWMESSTDNGKTWNFVPSNPISGTAVAHSPSIDIPDGTNPYEYIIYYTSDDAGSKVMLTTNFGNQFRCTVEVSGNLPLSNYDLQPVIAIKQNESNSKVIAVWRQPNMGYAFPAGLYYRVGTIGPDSTVTWNDSRVIDYTGNCSNPTVVASKTLTDPNQFHLSYQEDLGDGDSRIMYHRLDVDGNNAVTFSNACEVSQGSGYYVNTNPSITLSGGLPKVSWIGYDRVVTYLQNALFRGKTGSTTWGSVYTYGTSGNNAVSVSLDKVGPSGYFLSYGDDCGDIRYVKSTSPSTVRYADNTGSYVQVKGGPDFNNSFIESFHNESLPFYFSSSSTVSVLGKTNTETISGRGLNITKGGLGLSFNLKDVRLDGSQVDFNEESDSAKAQRNFIETRAFSVGDNSELTYSYSYFTSDSAKVLKSLKDGEVVNYSLDLVDATSKEVLKNLAGVSYSNKDVNKKRPEYYKLLLKGIGNRAVKLRISSDMSLIDHSGVVSTISKTYSTGSSLKKNGFIEVNYSDVKPVVEYGLSQNYPNPFNPSTVINYQIPKASKVTLKIYDMLGKEVTTLVNEYKEQGRYSVEFNASRLPSGTYIYEIRTNDFVKSGKMLLLK
jgi:hypothetical protein